MLHMTRARLLSELTPSELAGWMAYCEVLKDEEQQRALDRSAAAAATNIRQKGKL